jgi:hypothetical protein
MKIKKIYATSRGLFFTKEEASKKCNRQKVYSSFYMKEVREDVYEIYALVSDDGEFFKLSKITEEIK